MFLFLLECELVALLEDDTGMELLVNNKIISLDLPVDEVYRKIWCNGKSESKDPMKIIYRMRGLLGDATEDMVENLDSNKGINTNINISTREFSDIIWSVCHCQSVFSKTMHL